MVNCNTNHLYIVSFTAGADSGLAFLSAPLPSDAVSLLRNTGRYNGTPDLYQIIQCRDIGMSTSIRNELLLESYVNALVAYDVISNAIRKYIGPKGDNGKSAYEIAVENGYSGTEEEWLASLIPEIPDIPKAQIQSDWAQADSSAVDYIKNKPTVPENAVSFLRQSLTAEQRAQARQNIAACSADAVGAVELVEADTAVLYTAQELTVEQKNQARTNIGAGTSSFSGSYNDLSDKPTIPPVSNSLFEDKASTTKIPSTKETYDATRPPIIRSMPSGGMKPNVYYNLGTLTGNITFSLAEPEDANIVNHYFFSFIAGNPIPTITWPAGIVGWASGVAPTMIESVYYEVSILNGYAAYLDV